MKVRPRKPATPTHATTATRRMGSLTADPSALNRSRLRESEEPLLPRLVPGRRLTEIIMAMSRSWRGSGGVPERQADREHEERGDIVDVHRVEDAIRHLDALDGVGLLHRKTETVGDGLAKTRDAGAAAGGEKTGQTAARPRRSLEKGRRAIDTDRDLFGPGRHERRQRVVRLVTLEQTVGFIHRHAPLPHQIFLEAAGAHR